MGKPIMSTLVADKKNLKPLGIIIAAFYIVLALYSLVLLAFFLGSLLGGVFPESLSIGKIVPSVFDILWTITSVMLMIWFVLMKGHINNGARVVAIIGLSLLIVLDIFATITNICFTPEERGTILYSNELYTDINTFFSFANMILIGVAFIVMSRRFGKGICSWAMANGIIRLIQALVFTIIIASNYILPPLVPYERLISVHQFNNALTRVLLLANYITIIIFFFKFSLKEDE